MKNYLLASAVLLSGLMLVGCGDSDDTMTTPTVEVTEEIMIDNTAPEMDDMTMEEESMDETMTEEETMDDMTVETTVTTELEVTEK